MKRTLLFALLITASSHLCLSAGNVAVEQAVPVTAVSHIGGFFGQRMALNRDTYLKNFPIEHYADFVVERQHTAWDWTQAEQHGKWIESAYLSAIEAGDTALLHKAQAVLHKIIASQEPEGYLGATARSFRTPECPIRGMDPYELYFVFHAFITVYEQTGDREALTAAERLGDYFLKYFGPGKQEFYASKEKWPDNKRKILSGHSPFAGHSVHYAWEGTLLADPLARLYEVTGKRKYLDWAQWTVNGIDHWGGWDAFSRLDSVADGKLGIDQLQPYVHSHTFHMNFLGFLRLYRITGNKDYLRKVEGAWRDIVSRQMYITGGVSVAEHYEHGYVKPLSGNIVETCATMSWMQLTQELLLLTGDTKYADAIERLMFNHVFAAQDAAEGTCRYHTAPNGTKPQGYFHGPDCCTASGHRIISLLPTFLYAERQGEVIINQYLPSQFSAHSLSFTISGGYPETENVSLAITSARPVTKTLALRIPSWCETASMTVNGQAVEGVKAGSYIKLKRTWAKGDRVEIKLPMTTQWLTREHHNSYEKHYLKDGEIMYRELPAETAPVALMRGPVVYALDMVWNKQISNDDADIENDIRIDTTAAVEEAPLPAPSLLGPAFYAAATYKGTPCRLLLTPFANIGQWWRPGEQKPQKNASAFSYAIWLTR